MNISPSDLEAEYVRASHAWPFIPTVEATYGLPAMMLFAVGSRETNLSNEVGDGGHGHGVWQLDDRSHVIPHDFDTDVELQAHTAAAMLRSLLHHFTVTDPRADPVTCALDAYNAGTGTVQYNIDHGLPLDTGTAHGDYAEDTITRMETLQRANPEETGDIMATAEEVRDLIYNSPLDGVKGHLSLANTVRKIAARLEVDIAVDNHDLATDVTNLHLDTPPASSPAPASFTEAAVPPADGGDAAPATAEATPAEPVAQPITDPANPFPAPAPEGE